LIAVEFEYSSRVNLLYAVRCRGRGGSDGKVLNYLDFQGDKLNCERRGRKGEPEEEEPSDGDVRRL
jgi:hypothetical protein